MTWKTFTAAFAKYVNLDELVYDISLLVLALFLRGMFVPPGKTVVDVLTPLTAALLLIVIFFSVAYLVGFLQLKYAESLKDRPERLETVKGISVVTLIGMIITLTIVFVRSFPGADPVLWMACIFGGIGMAISGLSISIQWREKEGCSVSIFIFLLSSLILYLFLTFLGAEMSGNEVVASSAEPALARFGIAVVIFFVLFIVEDIISAKLFDGKNRAGIVIKAIIFNAVIPLLAALMMGFWQEIAAVGMAGVFQKGDALGFILAGVLFLTILGVRVLMALAPPYRIINTGIGIASFIVYIVMLVINIGSTAGVGQ
ncbi:MAG: hypothetical protein HPY53_05920 [Brevinematales bacterium]|nr:hypothetical protein [Brevinematales bacterium]